jgi:hypothetical protein
MEDLYWWVFRLVLDWCRKGCYCLDRNHWSLFPVVFDGRRLPLDVYDELMGTLMHGCIGETVGLRLGFHMPILIP